MRKRFLEILGVIALLGWFLSLVSIFIFFVANPNLFDRTKNVIMFLFEFFFLGSVLAYFGRRIKKNLKTDGSLSKSLAKLVADEPLVHAMIWLFIIAEIVVFSFILPVHFLTVRIVDLSTLQSIAPASIRTADLVNTEGTYALLSGSSDQAIFKSSRFLSWGDSLAIYVDAVGYENYRHTIPWSGFAIADLFRGIRLQVQLVEAEQQRVKVTLIVEHPASAMTRLTSPVDTSFQGAAYFESEKNAAIHFTVEAAGYQPFRSSFVAASDTALAIRLSPKPARLKILVVNEGGVEITGMDVFLDGKRAQAKSGEFFTLSPGEHLIRLEKKLSEDELAEVEDFTVYLQPGDKKEMKCKVEIKRIK